MNKKTLTKRLDKAHSAFILRRDKRCVLCGSTNFLQCSHLLAGRRGSTRWDTTPDGNCHAMCVQCHHEHHNGRPDDYRAWYIDTFGNESYDVLVRRHHQIRTWTRDEMLELIVECEAG